MTINVISSENVKVPLVFKSNELVHRVIDVVNKVFNVIKELVLFPTRYLGSKTWSLPGALIRSPKIIYDFLAGESKSESYHFHAQKKLTQDEARDYLKYSAAAVSSFENDGKWLRGLNLTIHSFDQDKLDLSVVSKDLQIKSNSIVNVKNGLKIVLIENDNEIICTFGAKHSLAHEVEEGEERERVLSVQNKSILNNLIGLNPRIYDEALEVFEHLENLGVFKGKKVTLTGQCFGSSIASYVALQKDCEAVGFNSMPLGAGIQQKLGDKVKNADRLITHISAEGDYVSDFIGFEILDRALSFIGIRTPGNFGKRFTIPSAYSNFSETHAYIMGSLMKYLGYSVRATPLDVMNAENVLMNLSENLEADKDNFINFDLVKQILIHITKQSFSFDSAVPANILSYYKIYKLDDADLVRLFAYTSTIYQLNSEVKFPYVERLRQSILTIKETIIRRSLDAGRAKPLKEILETITLQYPSIKDDIEKLVSDMDRMADENEKPFYDLVAKSHEIGFSKLSEAKLPPADEDHRPEDSSNKTRILHAALEYRKGKVGGLGAVTESLIPKQNEYGNDSRIVTPFFDFYHQHFTQPKLVGFVKHEFKGRMVESAVYKVQNGDVPGKKGVSHYLIAPTLKLRSLFDVGSDTDLYKNYDHSGGSDRLVYFSSAVAALAGTFKGKKHKKSFDVLHLHGWHVGISGLLMNTHYNPMRKKKIATVFNVHLATEQGIHLPWVYKSVGIPHQSIKPYVNIHADAMIGSDFVLFVSKTAAREALTKEEGCGLEELSLKKFRAGELSGVTNGITHKDYDPTTANFGNFRINPSENDLIEAKAKVKRHLYNNGFITHPEKPLFLFVGRYSSEKGVDMLENMIDEVRKQGGQCVIMGVKTQDPQTTNLLKRLEAISKDPNNFVKFSADLKFQTEIMDGAKRGNLIRLASDVVMVPSHEESCGLVPMESFSVGAVVVTSQVHGLKDTCFAVGDRDPDDGNAEITEENFNSFTYSNNRWTRSSDSRRAIREAMKFVQGNQEFRNITIKRLIKTSNRFDWLSENGAIEKIEKVYEMASDS